MHILLLICASSVIIFMHIIMHTCAQEVPPPLDLPELLAYLVKQSGPLFDQLGIRRGTVNLFS